VARLDPEQHPEEPAEPPAPASQIAFVPLSSIKKKP